MSGRHHAQCSTDPHLRATLRKRGGRGREGLDESKTGSGTRHAHSRRSWLRCRHIAEPHRRVLRPRSSRTPRLATQVDRRAGRPRQTPSLSSGQAHPGRHRPLPPRRHRWPRWCPRHACLVGRREGGRAGERMWWSDGGGVWGKGGRRRDGGQRMMAAERGGGEDEDMRAVVAEVVAEVHRAG